jgi:hypothetical protein
MRQQVSDKGFTLGQAFLMTICRNQFWTSFMRKGREGGEHFWVQAGADLFRIFIEVIFERLKGLGKWPWNTRKAAKRTY